MRPIIFFTEDLTGPGGVVRVISNWSNYFVKKGFDVETVSVKRGTPYFNLDSRVKFTIENFKFKNILLNIPYNTYKLYKFLKTRRDSNVIINKSLYIEPIWILRKFGLFKDINFIYFAHGGSSDFRDFYLSRPLVRHRLKMIFEVFDKVICLYDDEKNYPKQVKKEKLYFIPNPLPFEPSNVTFEEKENIVLSLGRITKEKGIDTLIKAWAKIESKFPDWKLQIVGDGKDKEEFIKLAKELNLKNIEFLPATTDVKPFYEKAKIFVIPSLFEGMPMTILEAMACKCCVVSSNTAGGKKLIKHSEIGLLFKIGNEKELFIHIEELINNEQKREEISLNSYKYVQQYKIENIANKWEKILYEK